MLQLLPHLLVAFFWGGSFVAIQAIVADAPPVTSAMFRVGIATILTFVYMKLRSVPRAAQPYRRRAMVSGIFAMAIPWALLFWAEQHVNAALGAIMNTTLPIFVLLFTPLFHRRSRMVPQQWLGILTAFAGIVVVFGPRVVQGPISDGWAILALAGMVISYAFSTCIIRRYLSEIPAARVTTWQGIAATPLLLVAALLTGEQVVSPVFWQVKTVWMGIAYLGICSTFIANLVFVKLIQSRGSVMASLVSFLIPIFSLLIEWVVFGQAPGPSALAGLALVMLGLYVVQFYKRRHFRREAIIPPIEEAIVD